MEKNKTTVNFKIRHRCGYEWTPRVQMPKSCPYCHDYLRQEGLDYEIIKVKKANATTK